MHSFPTAHQVVEAIKLQGFASWNRKPASSMGLRTRVWDVLHRTNIHWHEMIHTCFYASAQLPYSDPETLNPINVCKTVYLIRARA